MDLTLCADDGTELDLGTPADATPEQCAGACYTHHPSVRGQARRNRDTLAEALRTAGLVNYPTEWGHAANARWSKYMAREDQAYVARQAIYDRLAREVDRTTNFRRRSAPSSS
jgi:D-alanyl-D-alanine dipeptidase